MCIIQRGLVSETEGDNMTSQAGHHGGGSQLDPNQCGGLCLVHEQGFVKIKAARENVLSRFRALFQIFSSICFCKELLFLCSMAFMLTHAHGEEQAGICKLMDAAIIWEISSVVNFDTIGLLSPRSSTEQLPMQQMNVCIPHVHVNVDNHSTDPLGPLSPSRANVKVVMTVLAIIGGIRLVGRMLYKRWGAFTEADINMGLMREPAVVRRGDPTFEIRPSIE